MTLLVFSVMNAPEITENQKASHNIAYLKKRQRAESFLRAVTLSNYMMFAQKVNVIANTVLLVIKCN